MLDRNLGYATSLHAGMSSSLNAYLNYCTMLERSITQSGPTIGLVVRLVHRTLAVAGSAGRVPVIWVLPDDNGCRPPGNWG